MRLTPPVRLTAAALASGALGMSAGSVLVGGGRSPAPAPQSLTPVPGTERVGPAARDPGDGPDWALRVYRSTSGASCVDLGRLRGGRFGHLGAGGTFRADALDADGACGDLAAEPALVALNAYPALPDGAARTVVFGLAGRDVAHIVVRRRDGSLAARPAIGATGGFLVPLAGMIAPRELPVTVMLRDGDRRVHNWR